MSESDLEPQRPVRTVIKRALGALGLDLHRLPPPGFFRPHRDALADLKRLAGVDARVVFDAGANVGLITEQYAGLFPSAAIYAFEPTPEAFEALRERFRDRKEVRPFQLALSSGKGTARFCCNSFNQTNSLLPVSASSDEHVESSKTRSVESIEIQTVSLDGFCREQGIAKIDILKMDIQGAELMALNGAIGLISLRAIDLIFCEVLFAPLYENQAWFHDIFEFLLRNQYSLFGFYEFGYSRNGTLAWGDALFTSPALAGQIPGRLKQSGIKNG